MCFNLLNCNLCYIRKILWHKHFTNVSRKSILHFFTLVLWHSVCWYSSRDTLRLISFHPYSFLLYYRELKGKNDRGFFFFFPPDYSYGYPTIGKLNSCLELKGQQNLSKKLSTVAVGEGQSISRQKSKSNEENRRTHLKITWFKESLLFLALW